MVIKSHITVYLLSTACVKTYFESIDGFLTQQDIHISMNTIDNSAGYHFCKHTKLLVVLIMHCAIHADPSAESKLRMMGMVSMSCWSSILGSICEARYSIVSINFHDEWFVHSL